MSWSMPGQIFVSVGQMVIMINAICLLQRYKSIRVFLKLFSYLKKIVQIQQ